MRIWTGGLLSNPMRSVRWGTGGGRVEKYQNITTAALAATARIKLALFHLRETDNKFTIPFSRSRSRHVQQRFFERVYTPPK
jgi:hypothetical protein